MNSSNPYGFTAFNLMYPGAAAFLESEKAERDRQEQSRKAEPAPVKVEEIRATQMIQPVVSYEAVKAEALVKFRDACYHSQLNSDQLLNHWKTLIKRFSLKTDEFKESANIVFQLLMKKALNQEAAADIALIYFIKEIKTRITDRRGWINENLQAMTSTLDLIQVAQFVSSSVSDPLYKLLVQNLEERKVFLERSVSAIIGKIRSAPTEAHWEELIDHLKIHRHTNLHIWKQIWNLPNSDKALPIATEIGQINPQFFFDAISTSNTSLFDHLCVNDKMSEWIGHIIAHLSKKKIRIDDETEYFDTILKILEKRLFSSKDIKRDIAVYLQAGIMLLVRRPNLSSKYYKNRFADVMTRAILPAVKKSDTDLVDFCAGLISALISDKNGKWALGLFIQTPELFVEDTDHQSYLVQQILEDKNVDHAAIADKLMEQNDPLADRIALKLYEASDTPSSLDKAIHLLIRNKIVDREIWGRIFRRSPSETALALISEYLLEQWNSDFSVFYSLLSVMRDSQVLILLKTAQVERFLIGEVSEHGGLGRAYYILISRGVVEVENQMNPKKADQEQLRKLAVNVLKVHEKIAESGSNTLKLEHQTARTRLLNCIFKKDSPNLTTDDAKFCFELLSKYFTGSPDICPMLSRLIHLTVDYEIIISSMKILKEKGEVLDFGNLIKIKGLSKENFGRIFDLLPGYRIKISKTNTKVIPDLQQLSFLSLFKGMYEENLKLYLYLENKKISLDLMRGFRSLSNPQKTQFIEIVNNRLYQKATGQEDAEIKYLLTLVSDIIIEGTRSNINYISPKLLSFVEGVKEESKIPDLLLRQIVIYLIKELTQKPNECYLMVTKFMLRWGNRLKSIDNDFYMGLGDAIIKAQRKVVVRKEPLAPIDNELWKSVTDFIFFCTKDTKKLCPIHKLGTEEAWLGHAANSVKLLFETDYPQEDLDKIKRYYEEFKEWEAIERACLIIFSGIPEQAKAVSVDYVAQWKEDKINHKALLTRFDLLFKDNPSIEIWQDLLSTEDRVFKDDESALLFLKQLKHNFISLSKDVDGSFKLLEICLLKAIKFCEGHRTVPAWAVVVFDLNEIYLKTHDENSPSINAKLCSLIPQFIKLAKVMQKHNPDGSEICLTLFESIHGMIASCRRNNMKGCDLTTYLDYCLMYMQSLDEIIKDKGRISKEVFSKCKHIQLQSCNLLNHRDLLPGNELSDSEKEKLAICRLFWMSSYN